MRLESIAISNYKSFFNSGEIALDKRFLVVVGKNDSGKSALLEAMSLSTGARPHKSERSAPHRSSPILPDSKITAKFHVEPNDLVVMLQTQVDWMIPSRDNFDPVPIFRSSLENGGTIVGHWMNGGLTDAWLEALGPERGSTSTVCRNGEYPTGFLPLFEGRATANGSMMFHRLAQMLRERIYHFRAERPNVGQCQHQGQSTLAPNASNLADVLNQLSTSNTARYRRFIAMVAEVFPSIRHVESTSDGQTVRIRIWNVDPVTERADLAIPLAESGTGIGQVLAILYVVVTSDVPHVILIDEPQSFLHPGAARKLLEILRRESQHQYVISTHSPLALEAPEDEGLLLVRRDEQESRVLPISPTNQQDLQTCLLDVGARLSDVFGADSILWVEGKTEETCFPELLIRLAAVRLGGVQICGVISTDELTSKHSERVFDIYERLSGGTCLLPPAAAFVFDKEGRSRTTMDDIDRRSHGKMRWLPRRMYENYLLNPIAISRLLSEHRAEDGAEIAPAAISGWLNVHGAEAQYFAPGTAPIPQTRTQEWTETVHGAKILRDIFASLPFPPVEYDKVKHGLGLTRCLIEMADPELTVLAQLLAGCLTEDRPD